jgi:hypothetical protein
MLITASGWPVVAMERNLTVEFSNCVI